MVLSGALLFKIDGREVTIRSGDVMQILATSRTKSKVLEDSIVIDVFSPIRQDWIDKTDTYFRRTRTCSDPLSPRGRLADITYR